MLPCADRHDSCRLQPLAPIKPRRAPTATLAVVRRDVSPRRALLLVHGGALECQRGIEQQLLDLREDVLYQLLYRERRTLALLEQLPAAMCGGCVCTWCEEHCAVRAVSAGAVDQAKLRSEFGGAQPQRKVCVRCSSRIEMR